LGPFSYFPDWPREKAEVCHVLNRELLFELLRKTDAPVAALSGYSFVIECPAVMELPAEEQARIRDIIAGRYSLYFEVDGFGQAGTPLEVLLLK
jgi:hypothetical protein